MLNVLAVAIFRDTYNFLHVSVQGGFYRGFVRWRLVCSITLLRLVHEVWIRGQEDFRS